MESPNVFMVEPHDDFTVTVYFDDGKIKPYDAKPLIKRGGMFNILSNINFFKDRCVVMNKTLAWDTTGNFDPCECIDVCPDVIYGE